MTYEDAFGDACAWQKECGTCSSLLKSGEDGNVWRCALFRAGKYQMYAITARHEGRCGRAATFHTVMPKNLELTRSPIGDPATERSES
jgi:hypothetical protein